jgi:CRISPR/Cas system-associated exonuclease Cas4 (RecB family)
MKYNPWSISKLGTYLQCPHKFKLKYIDKIKVPFETNTALIKGSHIHKIIENGFDYDVPFDLEEKYTEEDYNRTIQIVKSFETSVLGEQTKKMQKIGVPEEDFAFTLNRELVNYWNKTAFFRGSADLYLTRDDLGIIIDYKSGKDKSEEPDFGTNQAKMYAIYMFLKFPEIQTVKAAFFFIEHGTKKSIDFSRDNLDDYINYFVELTNVVEGDTSYRKEVNALCDWCSYKEFGNCDGKEEPFHIDTGLSL